MIKLAVFDLDGTLIDSRRDICLAVNHALRTVDLPERSLEEVSSFVGEGAVKLVERAVAPRLELTERALAGWWEHYSQHLLDHTVLFPGLAELIARAPFPLAVHTNKPGRLARQILEGLGVLDRFVAVVGGDEAPRKPSPQGILDILVGQRVAAEDALLVGDSLVDLATARAVPVRFVSVAWGLVATDELIAAGSGEPVKGAEELASALGM